MTKEEGLVGSGVKMTLKVGITPMETLLTGSFPMKNFLKGKADALDLGNLSPGVEHLFKMLYSGDLNTDNLTTRNI